MPAIFSSHAVAAAPWGDELYQYDSLNRLTNLTLETDDDNAVGSFYYQLGSSG